MSVAHPSIDKDANWFHLIDGALLQHQLCVIWLKKTSCLALLWVLKPQMIIWKCKDFIQMLIQNDEYRINAYNFLPASLA